MLFIVSVSFDVLNMRTKSRVVCRNNSERPLGDDGSVNAAPAVVSLPDGVIVSGPSNSHTLVHAPIDVDTFDTLLDSDNGRGIGMMDMLDTVSDAIMIPDTDLDGMMDVNSSLDHTSILPDVPLPSVDVIGPRTRLSTGITINEPHPNRSTMETRNQRSQLSIDVVGKGKRKVDDIPGIVDFLCVFLRICACLFCFLPITMRVSCILKLNISYDYFKNNTTY